MNLLMPDPQEAQESGLTADYAAWRVWWAANVLGLKIRRRARTIRPEPGALDLPDEEVG